MFAFAGSISRHSKNIVAERQLTGALLPMGASQLPKVSKGRRVRVQKTVWAFAELNKLPLLRRQGNEGRFSLSKAMRSVIRLSRPRTGVSREKIRAIRVYSRHPR